MDNSQSSDCFPESAENSFFSPVPMDTVSYESLVAKTKEALCSGIAKELQKPTFSTYFATVLEDCYISINQSLELIASRLITESEVNVDKLSEYLNHAVCLLQLLSDCIKTIVEAVAIACCSLKSFPITTGKIIIIVFVHCKDSESLYGHNLSSVEKLLKDLFRNCHELQLTYLMILEKHLLFDLTAKPEQDILVKALDINLKIGEIVQSLDVKTMAEQWKAYMMICEKYSAMLSDTNVFADCTRVLCMLIRNNLKTALEKNQDDKLIIRSLKVASFTIKILLKTCIIFKNATRRDHSSILDLMFFMQVSCHLANEKLQSTDLLNTNILIPSECLLKELLADELFVDHLVTRDLELIKNDDTLFGFILTLASAMKCLALVNGKRNASKTHLIDCVYRVLPYCHVWINLDVRLKYPNETESHGVFEHLLTHTASLAFSLNNDELNALERNMIEAILSTECYSAMFSTNLWMIVARHANSQLIFNQLIWLCTMYKKLEKHKMFYRSPQKIYLSNTISGIFEIMGSDDKIKICKQFRINDDDNTSLWAAMRVNNLPDELRHSAEEAVFEKLTTMFHSLCGSRSEEIYGLIKVMSLASTCHFTNTRGIADFVVKAWLKVCPKHFTITDIDDSTVWFYDYLQALNSLTDSVWHKIGENHTNFKKVLHVISTLIQQCSVDIKLLLSSILCKLATCDICTDPVTIRLFSEAFSCLQNSEELIRNKLHILLTKYKEDRNFAAILAQIEENSLQESWCNIKNRIFTRCTTTCKDSREELHKAMDFKYSHKCLENRAIELSGSSNASILKKGGSGNFEFADMEDLFYNENESEQPLCKKFKLNMSEAEVIIGRLENDVSLLCNMKENLFTTDCRNRIQNVCNKLCNIMH